MNFEPYNTRFASLEDAPAIARVHVDSWRKIYRGLIPDKILNDLSVHKRTKQWEEIIKNGFEVIVIEKNNLLVGFASICSVRDKDLDPKQFGEISAFYLHPDVWRQGLGKKLCDVVLDTLAKEYKEVIVWVLEDNLQARKFYEAMGFIKTDNIKIDQYEACLPLKEIRYKKTINYQNNTI